VKEPISAHADETRATMPTR